MNILYLHSHDTGRCIGPYGYPAATPAFDELAGRGTTFTQAFAVASSCSASRASLQTGMYPHQNGMTGLAHHGWRLLDYDRHIVRWLRRVGYRSALIGEHHVAPDAEMIGYDEIILGASQRSDAIAEAATDWLASAPQRPWFLSCGFWETHRTSFQETAGALHAFPPLPDEPALCADRGGFDAALGDLDRGVGRVLDALDMHGLRDDTVVVATTDHAPGFPTWKANVTDRGLGVFLIIVAPDASAGATRAALVSHVDIFPYLCEVAGAEIPPWVQGTSLGPLLRGDCETLHDAIFAEANYHAAYEPQRSIRTRELRLVRRFDGRLDPVRPNIDDGPSKDWVLERAPELVAPHRYRLYDLAADPDEQDNHAEDPAWQPTLRELDSRLEEWMAETADPLLHGPVPAFEASRVVSPDARSPGGSLSGVRGVALLDAVR
jgi:arylsulfatase A-like enzyme